MLIKAGVDISRLERNTRRGLGKVNAVFVKCDEEMIVTSTFEGNHGAGSLHYANQAFDVRRPKVETLDTAGAIKAVLGADYDVVRETDHIHVEYDPKS